MPRKSVKKDKNVYFTTREAVGLTREKASELMEYISDDRIERIETGKSTPHPDEILTMAKCYNAPLLVNYFCTTECPIGQKYVPQLTESELASIVLQIMDSVNGLSNSKDNLIGITADGIITDDERPILEDICRQLDKISSAAGTLKLWMDRRLN